MQAKPEVLFPTYKKNPFKNTQHLLLICFYEPSAPPTVIETISNIQKHSKYQITVLNMFEHRHNFEHLLQLAPSLDLEIFDGVIIHNTVSYDINNLRSLDDFTAIKLKDYQGVKILMKQDEHLTCDKTADYIGEVQFDGVLTCLHDEAIPIVYPESRIGTPRIIKMLTGYITPSLRNIKISSQSRPIDIGYRGSRAPLYFGRLAYEKSKIGDDVSGLLKNSHLKLDISSNTSSRLGTDQWYNFLLSCKSNLAVEGGASIFDLDGKLEQQLKDIEEKLILFKDSKEYPELYLKELASIDNMIYNQKVTPSHFEAVATKTLLIMYSGKYSGIFKPNRHFLELYKDYSNLDKIVDQLSDDKVREQITECAYEEILCCPDYWIETFIENLDEHITDFLNQKKVSGCDFYLTPSPSKNILLLSEHDPVLDPRLDWIVKSAPKDLSITQLGVDLSNQKNVIRILKDDGHVQVINASIAKNLSFDILKFSSKNDIGINVTNLILEIKGYSNLSDSELSRLFSIPYKCERLYCLRAYFNYFITITNALITQGINFQGLNAIIAADLTTLPAALILKSLYDIPVFYDAHEYWPDSDVKRFDFESEFWSNFELELLGYVDYCQTVTPQLATLMSQKYNKEFESVPNCISKKEVVENTFTGDAGGKCNFIFQGGFSEGRGLELLIKAWPATSEDSILILRGPDNFYKDTLIVLAETLGLLNSRIFFPEAVQESKLITALFDNHVGLIPYEPILANNSNCCPNKMSQYFAARLPILANNTKYIKSTIESVNAGIVVDFNNPKKIVDAVNLLTRNKQLRNEMGQNGYRYLRDHFHWEKVSSNFYFKLQESVKNTNNKLLRITIPRNKTVDNNGKEKDSSSTVINILRCIGKYVIPLKYKKLIKDALTG